MSTPEPASSLRVDNASTHDTSQDSFTAPGVTQDHVLMDAGEQVDTLTQFLDANFPGEMQRTNRQIPETATETAMRLLLAFSSRIPPDQVKRCGESFCNKMDQHSGPHAWVHAG